ncbi:MAG: terminase small subunit [Betaproteobacteria bacterium]|nr:terminase small subunit [Betaproteobacteria bacterium]
MCNLTSRQEKFVDHYALCGNAAEAARLAGYSEKTARVIGPENLSKPAVKEALQARQQAYQAELGLTKDAVISSILEAIQMGREQKNPAVMIQGCVQLAKMLGFYEPEQVSVSVGVEGAYLKAKYAAMSDEELVAIIGNPR